MNPEKFVIKGLTGMASRPVINNDVTALLIKGMTKLEQPSQVYQSPSSNV